MKSNTKKRLIAFMLCMVLVLSSAISAFADEGTVHRVPTDTVELSSEIMKDGVSQGTLFAGVYKVALDNETNATTTLVATNGTLQVTGLDEGSYAFKETKAPEGYKVSPNNKEFTITANESAEVTVDELSFVNTKLSALPSTGGIGTTIFTIAGCVIMIAAAGLFFASRKKSDNK